MTKNTYCKITRDDKDIYVNMFNRVHHNSSYNISSLDESLSKDEYINLISTIDYFSNVYYNITNMCNFKCTYCYSCDKNEYISFEDNKIIINKLINLNTRSITLIGGEPTIHPNFLSILTHIISLNYFEDICIVTNGSLITDELIDICKVNNIYVQVSLDGYNEETNSITRGIGTFKLVYDNIIKLKDNKINFQVMQTLTKTSIANSIKMFDFFYNLGVPVGYFMVKKVEEKDKPSIEELENLLEHIYQVTKDVNTVLGIVKFSDNMKFDTPGFPITHCGAGINAISVDSNGDVYPCVKMHYNESKITNLLDTSDYLNDIVNNRKSIINHQLVFNKTECSECDIKYFCGGGCRAEGTDNNCNMFKFAFEYYFRRI